MTARRRKHDGQPTFQNLHPHWRRRDDGFGQRPKDCLRIEAIGEVDELNCAVGRVLVHDLRDAMRERLQEVQHKLFDLGGELSVPGYQAVKAEDITRLEVALNDFNQQLPPLKEFVLPGGGRAAARWWSSGGGLPHGTSDLPAGGAAISDPGARGGGGR